MAAKYTPADYVFQFVTVTGGVLIALLINGLVEWNQNRELVATARANLAREIADNKRDLDSARGSIELTTTRLDNAITFAGDLIKEKRTPISELKLDLDL